MKTIIHLKKGDRNYPESFRELSQMIVAYERKEKLLKLGWNGKTQN